MDLQQYRPLIEQLLPVYAEPGFDKLFARLTAGESASNRFLIKMELSRLMQPCRRGIDLRSHHSPTGCERLELHGQVHYLPCWAKEVFHTLVITHGGRYTTGVYESLLLASKAARSNATLPMPDGDPDPVSYQDFTATTIPLGQTISRREARLRVMLAVRLFVTGEVLSAQTSDLSLLGLRLRVPLTCAVVKQQSVELQLVGIQSPRFNELKAARLPYQVVDIEHNGQQQWLRLEMSPPLHPQWRAYFEALADSDKGRRKVNVDDALAQVRIRGYEQYHLSRLAGLPLYFSHPTTPRLSYLLLNESNQEQLNYWFDGHRQLALANLPGAPGIDLQPSEGSPGQDELLYSFTIQTESHIHHYLASATQLTKTGLGRLFTAFGARQSSWRVFRLVVNSISPTQCLELQSSWEDLLLEQHDRQQLQGLCAVGMLYELTSEEHRRSYREQPLPAGDLNVLQQFRLPASGLPDPIPVHLEYRQQRREIRFKHRSVLTLRYGERRIPATTLDFSVNGLCLELEQPLALTRGDRVLIDLDQLQSLTSKYNLRQLPYRVTGSRQQNTVLHLQADGSASSCGHGFFQQLIEANRDKLRPNPGRKAIPGLALALRHIYLRHSSPTLLYVHQHQHRMQLDTLGVTSISGSLAPVFEAFAPSGQWNLYPLLQQRWAEHHIFRPLRRLQREDDPLVVELYLQLLTTEGSRLPQVNIQPAGDFGSDQERQRFVDEARRNGGQFYSFLLLLARAGELDMEFIAKELELVSKHALRQARVVADELEQVVGIIELVDTTRETLFRLDLIG